MQKKINRKINLSLLALVIIVTYSCQSPQKASEPDRSKPNILVIFMDDMGYGDLGCYGAIDYKTTNLNTLADQGMRFTNFYAAQAVCSASRAGLLTGCYPNRVGIHGALFPGQKIGISTNEQTIADILKQADYATGMIGKWHLGDTIPCLPLQHGFDEYFGIPYSNDMWPVNFDGTPAGPDDFKSNYPPLPILDGNKPARYIRNLDDMSMVTSLYTERAIDFIKRHKDHPFFLYLAESMVHVPIAASEKFRGKSKQGLFGDVMEEIDYSIGEILKTLKENGLEENTLVVFTSDNGPWLNFGNHAGSTGGLREGKGTSWEGGQREDCIMKWPGVIPAGTICEKLSSTIDLLPTFANITKAPMPKNKIDGVNILPLLKDEDVVPRDHLYYYYQVNSLEAVRQGHWKLVFPHDYRSYEGVMPGRDGFPGDYNKAHTGLALYDLRRDPGEHYDVKEMFPEVVKQLEALGDEARQDLGDDLTGAEGANRRPPMLIPGREHNKAPWEK